MIYFKSKSGRDDVMATLNVEEVIWHESQSSSAAESEAGEGRRRGFGKFHTRLTARGGYQNHPIHLPTTIRFVTVRKQNQSFSFDSNSILSTV